jgi:hypothetical protein
VTLQDYLLKYGTRMASNTLRQSRGKDAKQIADDLQAALENYITHEKLRDQASEFRF